jgi:hypothetical protein
VPTHLLERLLGTPRLGQQLRDDADAGNVQEACIVSTTSPRKLVSSQPASQIEVTDRVRLNSALTSSGHGDDQLARADARTKESLADLQCLALACTRGLGNPDAQERPDKGAHGGEELRAHGLVLCEARLDEDGVIGNLRDG